MRKVAWMVAGIAALALVLATPAVSHESHGKRMFFDEGDKIDLADLNDGETRTFGEGEHQVTATRTGDVISIVLGDGDGPRTFNCTAGEDDCFVISPEDGDAMKIFVRSGDASDMESEIMIMQLGEMDGNEFFFGDEGLHGEMEVVVSSEGGGEWVSEDGHQIHVAIGAHECGHDSGECGHWTGDDGENVRVIMDRTAGGPGGMPELLRLHTEGTLLRCPEGDTTMRLKKDAADQGPFLCPLHNTELEKVEHKMHRMHDRKPHAHDD